MPGSSARSCTPGCARLRRVSEGGSQHGALSVTMVDIHSIVFLPTLWSHGVHGNAELLRTPSSTGLPELPAIVRVGLQCRLSRDLPVRLVTSGNADSSQTFATHILASTYTCYVLSGTSGD